MAKLFVIGALKVKSRILCCPSVHVGFALSFMNTQGRIGPNDHLSLGYACPAIL